MDGADVAWQIVRRMRDRFVGSKRQPTDDDWREAIESVLSKFDGDDADSAYDEGYDDALAEIESTVQSHMGRRRMKKRSKPVATASA